MEQKKKFYICNKSFIVATIYCECTADPALNSDYLAVETRKTGHTQNFVVYKYKIFVFNFEYRLHEIFQFIHTLTSYTSFSSSKVVPIFVSHKNLYLVDLRSEIYADPTQRICILQNWKKKTFVGRRANLCRPPIRRNGEQPHRRPFLWTAAGFVFSTITHPSGPHSI